MNAPQTEDIVGIDRERFKKLKALALGTGQAPVPAGKWEMPRRQIFRRYCLFDDAGSLVESHSMESDRLAEFEAFSTHQKSRKVLGLKVAQLTPKPFFRKGRFKAFVRRIMARYFHR